MATLTNLGTANLSLKGSGDSYNNLSRFFETKAQADAALADYSWVPVAGRVNAALTADQGLLIYNTSTQALDVADTATRAYVDTKLAALTGDAPALLDTLGEIADALNDDPNYFTTAAATATANTNLINAETSRATAAEATIQADVDQNEADADAAIAAVQADVDANEAAAATARTNLQTTLQNAINAVQADADQNESDADAAIAAVQSDVNQNEADADAAIAAENTAMLAAVAVVQADVNQNETDADAAIAAVQADVNQNEADADAAIAAVQSDVDANEADRKTYFKWEGNVSKVVNPVRSSKIEVGNNIAIDPASGFATQFDGNVEFDNNTTLSHGGTELTATFAELNFVDGVTSNVQTQMNTKPLWPPLH